MLKCSRTISRESAMDHIFIWQFLYLTSRAIKHKLRETFVVDMNIENLIKINPDPIAWRKEQNLPKFNIYIVGYLNTVK